MTSGWTITILLSFISVIAMARQEPSVSSGVKETKIAQVFFNPGAKSLTGREKAELHGFVNAAIKDQKIKDIKILSWSDRIDTETLKSSKPSRIELADARGEAIKKFLKDDLHVEASTYNMAEGKSEIGNLLKEENVYEGTDSTTALILVMLE